VKARCVGLEDGSVDFTLGKVYEVDEYDKLDSFLYHIMGDNGKKYWCHKDNFILIPDEPAPKSDWMRYGFGSTYLNVNSGIILIFEDNHTVTITHIVNIDSRLAVRESDADAFAALVGYEWPKGE
jgi:hypothetical protein